MKVLFCEWTKSQVQKHPTSLIRRHLLLRKRLSFTKRKVFPLWIFLDSWLLSTPQFFIFFWAASVDQNIILHGNFQSKMQSSAGKSLQGGKGIKPLQGDDYKTIKENDSPVYSYCLEKAIIGLSLFLYILLVFFPWSEDRKGYNWVAKMIAWLPLIMQIMHLNILAIRQQNDRGTKRDENFYL